MVDAGAPSLGEMDTENEPNKGLASGTIVAGKLRVIRLLGAGGMGAVYEVEHELTRHRRALKLLHPEIAKNQRIVTRFLREASAAGHIGSAHIAETFDAGTLDSGEPYLVMEMLQGETLELRLSRTGPMNIGELASLVRQTCDGIQAAHDAGIVHRDLKPENIFITRLPTADGKPFVKILDFGISKFDEERTGNMGMTAEGAAMGTPYYMPPEQVNGEREIDGRADIYALGVILYQCACAHRPFEASSLTALAVLIHEGKPVPLDKRRADLPPLFVEIVHRAMAVRRDERFPTARALADALAPFADGADSEALDSTLPPANAADNVRIVVQSMPAPALTPDDPRAKTGDAVAMGRTITSTPSERPKAEVTAASGSRGKVILGAIVVAAIAVAAFVATRGGYATRDPSTATSLSPGPSMPMPPVGAGTLPQSPSSTSTSTSTPTSTSTSTASARPLPTPSASVAVAPPPSASARPKPTASTRVDQKGLAGENPF